MHTSIGSLFFMNGISMSLCAHRSLHMRSFNQQELLQPYPNRLTEIGYTNSGELITGSRELSKTNYCSYQNSNLDQETDSRNQRGKQKLYKVERNQDGA